MPKLRVASIALATVDGMPAANYERALRLTRIALSAKPDLVLLPEAFAAGYCGIELGPYAEPPGQPYGGRFAEVSRQGRCLLALGYLTLGQNGKVRNVVSMFDQGELIGTHAKHTLFPDAQRPYRDEPTLMERGAGIEVFNSRLGRFAVLICYENMFPANQRNWDQVGRQVDFVLSPYNCQCDPEPHNLQGSKLIGKPSVWADRTGTVYCGPENPLSHKPNPGSAGIADAQGRTVARSPLGVEQIVTGEIEVP